MSNISSMEMSVQDEINNVQNNGRPHVVILGSGGSVAALPNGDKNGILHRGGTDWARLGNSICLKRI